LAVDALGIKGWWTAKESFVIDSVAPTASATPPTSTFFNSLNVTLASNESADIYYTLDGVDPTTSSTKYISAITLVNTTVVKYISVDKAGNVSSVYTDTYTALVRIAGTIKTVLGSMLSGVEVAYSNGGGTATTDANGIYEQTLTSGWSGIATPSKAGYKFEPVSRIYTIITTNKIGEDYTGIIRPQIAISKNKLNYGAQSGGLSTQSQQVIVSNLGGGMLSWTAIQSANWITITPASGTGSGAVNIGVNPAGLASGNYSGMVSFSDPNATDSPQDVIVSLTIFETNGSPPFGSFDTPLENSTVCSSIPITGWALDDIGIEWVKIYRNPEPGELTQPNGLAFIGTAFFVEGARKDVERIFSSYPMNYKGGWGYMMLTNFLPYQGNGTFVIHAIARDKEGNEVTIGTKTIACDNANAAKPFGAIDTPTQGGTAFGSLYYNFGWALTPPPKYIPTDGSTIGVWVNGIKLGNPAYGQSRPDIVALFPGYANSSTGVGVYNLDTTGYPNGVHNIAWSVMDSDGATDGIGSRFFNILNTGASANTQAIYPAARMVDVPLDVHTPVYIRRGYDLEDPVVLAERLSSGEASVEIHELERIAIYLNPEDIRDNEEDQIARGRALIELGSLRESSVGRIARFAAYLVVGDEIRPLPIGTTFDEERGVLYWQPGPGFLGDYDFVIIIQKNKGKIPVRVTIKPQFE
jgi:hypothetical protein